MFYKHIVLYIFFRSIIADWWYSSLNGNLYSHCCLTFVAVFVNMCDLWSMCSHAIIMQSVVLLKFLCHRKINMKNTPHSKLPTPSCTPSPPLQSSKVRENQVSYHFLQWMLQIRLHIIFFFQNYFCGKYHHCLQHRVFQASIIMLVTTIAIWWDGPPRYFGHKLRICSHDLSIHGHV